MKKNNTLKVLLITLLFTFLLTWIIPITYYSGGLFTDQRYQIGLFDMFNYPTLTFYYFGQIAIYLIVVGAFYAIFNKTGVYRKVVDRIVKIFKGKENIFFATTVTLLATIVAFCGFSYELIFVLPLLTSIILLMGYDKITIGITFIGSIIVGTMGSLFAANISGIYNQQLTTEYIDLIWFKIAMLVIGMILVILNIILYNKKINNKKKELNNSFIPEKIELKNKKGKTKSIIPALIIFDLIIIIMIISTIDFANAFNITIFEKFHENVMAFTIKDFPIFSKIIGSTMSQYSLGSWTNIQIAIIITMATILLAVIYRIKLSDLFSEVKDGAKKFGLSILLCLLAYVAIITTSNHPIVLTILKPLLTITDGFNSVTLSISMFIVSIFNIEPYYIASSIIPYLTSIITDVSIYPLIALLIQCIQGIAMLIAPTSIILLATIAYLDIPYTEWFKKIWKLLLELLVVAFIIFTIVLLI